MRNNVYTMSWHGVYIGAAAVVIDRSEEHARRALWLALNEYERRNLKGPHDIQATTICPTTASPHVHIIADGDY